MRGTRVKIRGTRVKIRGTRVKIRGTRVKIRGTRVKIRGTRVKIRDARGEHVAAILHRVLFSYALTSPMSRHKAAATCRRHTCLARETRY